MTKKEKKEWLLKQIASQKEWIQKCGGDLAGYIDKYHGKYHRTVENATEIYEADVDALRLLEEKLGEIDISNKKRTKQRHTVNVMQIAERIVTALQENTKPGACVWGDMFPEAHAELFKRYWLDLAADVEFILRSNLPMHLTVNYFAKSCLENDNKGD